MCDQNQQTTEAKEQKVMVQLPIIHTEIHLKVRYYNFLHSFGLFIILALLMVMGTVLVLIVPIDGPINQNLVLSIFHFGIGLATPAMLGLIGEIIGQNSGTYNLGLEGVMSISAFSCFLAAYITQNLITAVIVAALIGGLVGLIHTLNVNYFKSNQALSGMGINLTMVGLGGFLYLAVFGASRVPPQIPTLPEIPIPFLSDIPIWGYTLFQQSALTYLAILLAVAAEIVLNRSRLGMQIKAVGQNPKAAATAGINVSRVRIACSVFGGMTAGIGGGFLTLNTGFFTQTLVYGRGWIAFAFAQLALSSPIIGIFTSLIFGFGLAIQFRMQALQLSFLPYEFFWMIPYIFTIIALFFYSIRQKRRHGE